MAAEECAALVGLAVAAPHADSSAAMAVKAIAHLVKVIFDSPMRSLFQRIKGAVVYIPKTPKLSVILVDGARVRDASTCIFLENPKICPFTSFHPGLLLFYVTIISQETLSLFIR